MNKTTQNKVTQQSHKCHMWGPLTLIHAPIFSVVVGLRIFLLTNRPAIVNCAKHSIICFFHACIYMYMCSSHAHLSSASEGLCPPDLRGGSAPGALGWEISIPGLLATRKVKVISFLSLHVAHWTALISVSIALRTRIRG